MKSFRVTSIIVLVKGILMILLGFIHIAASYFALQDAQRQMSEIMAAKYTLWFGLLGLFFIFTGTIDILSYTGLRGGVRQVWRTAFCSAIFTTLCGATGTAVLLRVEGPPIFPILVLFLGAIVLAVLQRRQDDFMDRNLEPNARW